MMMNQKTHGGWCNWCNYDSSFIVPNSLFFYSESTESMERSELGATNQATDPSCESQSVVNAFIASIADRIDSDDIDIQTKRLYKKYIARKQRDQERKEQVWDIIKIARN